MPQASDAQRAVMEKWFGSIDDAGPTDFLLARGWSQHAGVWSKPTPNHNPSAYEIECLLFLRDEWDYDFHRPIFQESFSGLLEEE